MSLNKKVLVTGAGGFIGGWIVETLFLQGDTNVRAGVHNWGGAARPARFPIEIVPCDIMKPHQLLDAMEGVQCVIHCAKGGSKESIVDGTRNTLEAARKQGVEKFIYISTTEVFGNQIGNINEHTPCESMNDPYGDSKIKAEEICWMYNNEGLPVVIIRPPIVYGPFSKTFTVNIAYKLLAGNWGLYKGLGDGLCNLVYISDLVFGILAAANSEKAVGEVFILNGPELITWNEYFQRFNQALGLPDLNVFEQASTIFGTRLNEPLRSLIRFARYRFERTIKKVASKNQLARRFMKYIETRMKSTPHLSDFRLYSRKVIYQSDKAREMLGYKPAVYLDTGLAMSVEWIDQIGLRNFIFTKGYR